MASPLQCLIPELLVQVVDRVVDGYAEDNASRRRIAKTVRYVMETWRPSTEVAGGLNKTEHSGIIDEVIRKGPEGTRENWHYDSYRVRTAKSTAWKDLISLARTCRRFYEIIIPILYRLDVEENCASALLISSRTGNVAAVSKSLDAGADPNTLDDTVAISYRSRSLQYWYQLPVRESVVNSVTLTALHWAAMYGHEDIVALLLERGANVHQRAEACPYSDPTCDLLLVARESSRNFFYGFGNNDYGIGRREDLVLRGANPLFYALAVGLDQVSSGERDQRERIAHRLIDAGSSLMTHIGFGIHAHHQAVCNSTPAMVKYLLKELPADPLMRDYVGNTAAHHMIYTSSEFPDVVKSAMRLVKYGGDLNVGDVRGHSALDILIYGEFLEGRYATFREPVVALALVVAGARLTDRTFDDFMRFWPGDCEDEAVEIVNRIRSGPRGQWDPAWNWMLDYHYE